MGNRREVGGRDKVGENLNGKKMWPTVLALPA